MESLSTYVLSSPTFRPAVAGICVVTFIHPVETALRLLFRTLAMTGLALALAAPSLAQESQERVIRFGHLNNADHPVSFGVKRFSELLAAKSGGKMKVQEFPASQLGNEMQQQSALQGG